LSSPTTKEEDTEEDGCSHPEQFLHDETPSSG
jgi:hypothetical protein